MKNYNLYYLDTCLPDYFRGHHNPVVQIPVTHESTYAEIKEELLNCLNTEHIEDLCDEGFKQAVEELFTVVPLDKIPKVCLFIEEYTEEGRGYFDSVYMFFCVEEVCEEAA